MFYTHSSCARLSLEPGDPWESEVTLLLHRPTHSSTPLDISTEEVGFPTPFSQEEQTSNQVASGLEEPSPILSDPDDTTRDPNYEIHSPSIDVADDDDEEEEEGEESVEEVETICTDSSSPSITPRKGKSLRSRRDTAWDESWLSELHSHTRAALRDMDSELIKTHRRYLQKAGYLHVGPNKADLTVRLPLPPAVLQDSETNYFEIKGFRGESWVADLLPEFEEDGEDAVYVEIVSLLHVLKYKIHHPSALGYRPQVKGGTRQHYCPYCPLVTSSTYSFMNHLGWSHYGIGQVCYFCQTKIPWNQEKVVQHIGTCSSGKDLPSYLFKSRTDLPYTQEEKKRQKQLKRKRR